MSNELMTTESRSKIIAVLRDSLYPGATAESVGMVLDYCSAAGYDPMMKPVHIVPMWDKNAKTMRDTIMPGIGLYRIIADRSGKYAGQDDAEFGPDIEKWGMTFPQWCKVTVWKITHVGRVPYSAKVFWLESYANAGKDNDSPNAMWRKRPYGQLEKCAEAAALRKAFPEIGAQPTADEMIGKHDYEDSVVTVIEKSDAGPKPSRASQIKATLSAQAPVVGEVIDETTGEVISEFDRLMGLIESAKTLEDLGKVTPVGGGIPADQRPELIAAWTARKKQITGNAETAMKEAMQSMREATGAKPGEPT